MTEIPGAGPLAAAVVDRDQAKAEALLVAGVSANDHDERGQPALVLASESNQFRLALLLVEQGADIWFVDPLGFSPAHFIEQSLVAPDSEEGQAREAVIRRMRAAGMPWPPPSRADVLAMREAGKWPPKLRAVTP